jgi:hypothetical protein
MRIIVAKRLKSSNNKGHFKADDPRRYVAPKGNKNALGNPGKRNNFVTQQLIALLNEPYHAFETDKDGKVVLDKNGNPKRLRKSTMSKVAKMCRTLYEMAAEDRDLAAIEFIWDRTEGKLTQKVGVNVNHTKRLELAAKNLTDEELEVMARVSKKMLEAEGVKVIEHVPESPL